MSPERLLKHFEQICEAPDAVPRLRRFILDLAVRGKLIAQDARDEPVGLLVAQIHAERIRRAKSGEPINPEISVESAKGKFLIPSSWKWVRLGFATNVIMGQSPPGVTYNTHREGMPLINGPVEFTEGAFGITVLNQYTSAPTKRCKKGDLLLCVRGSTTGRTNVAGFDACIGRGVAALQPLYADKFIRLFVWASREQIIEMGRGIAFPSVSRQQIEDLPTPFPPLAEQERIVARVYELMALCDKLEAAQAKREKRRDRLVAATLHGLNNGDASPAPGTRPTFKESARFYLNHLPRLTTRPEHIHQLRQTILNLAVRGKLVPQDPNDEPAAHLIERVREWRVEAIKNRLIRSPRKPLKTIDPREMPYARPDGWAWARLGEVIYIQSGDGLTAANMKAGAVPVYGGNGINGYHDAFNVEESAIVIGRVGYHCGSIHVTPEKAWVTDNAFITKFCSHEIFLGFLVLLLQGTNLKERENATAQPVISGSKIYPIVVGIPPLAEQHRIVTKVGGLMVLCDKLEARLTTHATARRQLLEATLQKNLGP